ncbi:Polysaccharide deacetylase [Rhizoctonia solani]|uniref:Polysaccharide deacetylase n=1 Tax=Rhizoctonia solani TaxID=456999 RepID=A0A8H7LK58_9AGAM|nr:Polysaccharide deacetylase [Rhizoctonia solani]
MQLFVKFALVSSIASSFLGTFAAPTNSTLFPRQLAQVITKCTVPNTVALTFDDGPYLYTYEISERILQAGGKATFFVNGNNYQCIYHPDNVNRIKYLYEKGHQIGSHTWGHKDLTTLTWDQVHDEMWRVEQALMRIIGANPAYMRPPFGKYNDNVLRASAVRGQKVAIWDFDSGDSAGISAAASKRRYDDVTARRPSNILTLNHETYEPTARDILPHAIAKLQAAGYRMVTLSECLGESPAAAYQSQGPPATVRFSHPSLATYSRYHRVLGAAKFSY